MFRKALPVPALVAGLSLIWGAADAAETQAHKAAPAIGEGVLEEVVVTARRREESLQVVPISVTALSGEALAAKGIDDAFALSNHIPSVRLQASEISPRLFTTSIRGLKSVSYLVLDDPPVGTYFAEGVVGHPYGFGASFYDIQSVQVLKGPQGTLFGRNTTGGAILVEPNKASIDEGFDGNAKLSLGNYNLQKFQGAVNIPLNDVAAVRIAGAVDRRDGYTKNDLTGQMFDGIATDSLRLSLLLKPVAGLSSHTVLDYLRDHGSPNSGLISNVYSGGGSSYNSAVSPAASNATANALALWRAQQARGYRHFASALGTDSFFDAASPANCIGNRRCRSGSPSQEIINWGFLNNTEYEFNPDLRLKNILSYRYAKELTTGNNYSPGALTAIGTQSILADDVSQWSEEIQLSGKSLDGKLDWAAGFFTMQEWGKDRTITYTFSATPPVRQVPGGAASAAYNANWTGSWGDGVSRSAGLYAQGTYQLADRLKGTLGLRHNNDRRQAVDTSPSANGTGCLIPAAERDTPTVCRMSDHKEFGANTYTASLEYQWNDQTLLYLARRKGYKSGGYSLRIHARSKFAYAPEFATDYELGVKSDWKLANMPIRTNLALYETKLTDMQVPVSNAAVTPIISYTDNVGKGRVRGYEFEFSLLPSERWEVSGFVSYTSPKVLDYKTPVPGGFIDVSWRNIIGNGMPKWQGGLSTKYTQPLDAGSSLALQADLSLRSATVTSNQYAVSYTGPGSATLSAAQKTSLAFIQPTQAGFGVLNLRADWKHPFGSPVDLGFFVTNAGDIVYKQGCNASGGTEVCNYAAPRMFGLELSYRFGEGFKPAN